MVMAERRKSIRAIQAEASKFSLQRKWSQLSQRLISREKRELECLVEKEIMRHLMEGLSDEEKREVQRLLEKERRTREEDLSEETRYEHQRRCECDILEVASTCLLDLVRCIGEAHDPERKRHEHQRSGRSIPKEARECLRGAGRCIWEAHNERKRYEHERRECSIPEAIRKCLREAERCIREQHYSEEERYEHQRGDCSTMKAGRLLLRPVFPRRPQGHSEATRGHGEATTIAKLEEAREDHETQKFPHVQQRDRAAGMGQSTRHPERVLQLKSER